MKGLSKKEDYLRKVELGYARMKTSRVAICSIVRDCESGLKTNIPVMTDLRNRFRESHVVVVENDSKDGTKQQLARWSKNAAGVHVLSEDIGVQTIPPASGAVKPCYSAHRVGLMAGYRNKYMEFLEDQDWELDYVIIVDLDLARISLDGIANSFGQAVEWDAITSNGKGISKRGYYYHDAYAVREVGDHSPQTESMIHTYQNLLSGLSMGMPMLRVDSAFNGLGIYQAQAIKGLKYRCELNDDAHVEAHCEHVAFHQDMKQRERGLIYINPSQVVYYSRYWSLPVLKMILRRLFRFKRVSL